MTVTELEPGKPINLVFNLDGTPLEHGCACPVCDELTARGVPTYTGDGSGRVWRVPAPPPQTKIDVQVQPGITIAPVLGTRPLRVRVPRATRAGDFIEFLALRHPAIGPAVQNGALELRRARRTLARNDRLRAGDRVTLISRVPHE